MLLDSDSDCPAELGPTIHGWAVEAEGGVPCGVVLAHREYEAWFLAAIESLRGHRSVRINRLSARGSRCRLPTVDHGRSASLPPRLGIWSGRWGRMSILGRQPLGQQLPDGRCDHRTFPVPLFCRFSLNLVVRLTRRQTWGTMSRQVGDARDFGESRTTAFLVEEDSSVCRAQAPGTVLCVRSSAAGLWLPRDCLQSDPDGGSSAPQEPFIAAAWRRSAEYDRTWPRQSEHRHLQAPGRRKPGPSESWNLKPIHVVQMQPETPKRVIPALTSAIPDAHTRTMSDDAIRANRASPITAERA